MFIEVGLFVILIIYPVLLNVFGKVPNPENKSKANIYRKDICVHSGILMMYFFLKHESYDKINFLEIGRGFIVSEDILNAVMTSYFVPIVIALFPNSPYLKGDSLKDGNVFGFPVSMMPENKKQLIIFFLFILVGVVFEELFCRQFVFYFTYSLFNLRGDYLLVISTILFTIGHKTKKISQLLPYLIMGLLFGKIFQMTGSILVPIIIHLGLNLTIVILAFRRIYIKKSTVI